MSESTAIHHARKTERTALKPTTTEPSIWRWPRQRIAGEPTPDSRLLSATIAGLSAEIQLADGRIVQAGVRAVSQNDIVLDVPCLTVVPVLGQVVEVSLSSKQWSIVSRQKCILHWSGMIHGECVVAMFSVDRLGEVVEQWTYDQPRGEIRFPLDLPVTVEVSDDVVVVGRILDYSLNGCRFLCNHPIALDQLYPARIQFANRSIELGIHPRWVQSTEDGFQMGCSFESERGVLMACRHHAPALVLESALKPQITNWPAEGEIDEAVDIEW